MSEFKATSSFLQNTYRGLHKFRKKEHLQEAEAPCGSFGGRISPEVPEEVGIEGYDQQATNSSFPHLRRFSKSKLLIVRKEPHLDSTGISML